MLWKENIREFMKRIRQRPVRSGGSGRTDRMMWVVQSDEDGDGWTKMGTAGRRWGRPDEDGDGWTKMGTNPDITPPSKVQRPDAPAVKGEVLVGECGGTQQLTT